MATPVFKREPIFWTTTQAGYNDADRTRRSMVNGKPVTERIPQRGHLGDYEDRLRAPGIRFLTMVRHDGHIISHVLTNGAAHMDHTTAYGQYAMQKARFLGWFTPGECPCALVAARTIAPETIQCPSNKGAQPCVQDSYSAKNPCKHALDEIAVRRDRRTAENFERLESAKSDNAKNVELQAKTIDALREQTATIVKAVLKQGEAEPDARPKKGEPR